jgi:fumarylacetoacetate (FAA) hydrolase
MKLASLRGPGRDGTLIVVRKDGQVFARAGERVPTLQAALDTWDFSESYLQNIADRLERGEIIGEPLDTAQLSPPLPRAYEWVDGSAYINHIVLVRKARGAEPPETLRTDPLVYQGGSSVLLGPTENIVLHDERWGLDFESEICVILGDVPLGTKKTEASKYIRLLCLANDITLRNLVPVELAKGFGFFNSKPATAFSPFAVTPDEIGAEYRDGRVFLRLRSTYNGQLVGDCDAGPEMHFSFFDLIEHIAKTRAFGAGTILGSGTVSNEDETRGISCLAERRMRETITQGAPKTPFMKVGDTIAIEMSDTLGQDIFGRIEQKVVSP